MKTHNCVHRPVINNQNSRVEMLEFIRYKAVEIKKPVIFNSLKIRKLNITGPKKSVYPARSKWAKISPEAM